MLIHLLQTCFFQNFHILIRLIKIDFEIEFPSFFSRLKNFFTDI